jgi:hypothetical protein
MLICFNDLVSIVEGIDIEFLCKKIYLKEGETCYNETELLNLEINKIIMKKYGIGIDIYKNIVNQSIVQIKKGGLIYEIDGVRYTVKNTTNSEKKQIQKIIFNG